MSAHHLVLTLIATVTIGSAAKTHADEPTSTDEVQLAVERGLFFVEQSSVRWWRDEQCASCHHGPILLFSHNIAKRQGIPVNQDRLDFWIDRWVLVSGMVNTRNDGRMDAGGMLGAPLTLLFRDLGADTNAQRAETLAELLEIAANDWHQEDGSWDIGVGFDYTPWIALALESMDESAMPLSIEHRHLVDELRQQTETWIQSTEHSIPEKTEELAGWLIYEHQRGNSDRRQLLLDELLSRQTNDGLWGITAESEAGHLLITGAVLFALTSIGLDTSDPVVAETQRLLLDAQLEDGRWREGGRIFDEGLDIDNPVYNMWATGIICAALSQTIELPPDAEPLFVPDAVQRQDVNAMAEVAADGYDGHVDPPEEMEMPAEVEE